MGTPEFAVPSLEILVNAGYNIVAVITSPDKFGGRGRKTLIQSAIKKCALSHELPVLQPKNLKAKSFVEELKGYKADLQIVVAFRMLPVVVWDMPEYGTYNLHGSLLPAYRGAAPINWSVINGDKETGVTSFKLKHAIDTGSIAIQKKLPIYDFDNATEVHNRMMYIGAEVVYETVRKITKNEIVLNEQSETNVTHAPKLNKDNTVINFNQSTKKVYDFVRGLSQYPAAWMTIDNKKLKIYQSEKEISQHQEKPGLIFSDNKKTLKVSTEDGFLVLLEVQLSGKRRMSIKEFLNGYRLDESHQILQMES